MKYNLKSIQFGSAAVLVEVSRLSVPTAIGYPRVNYDKLGSLCPFIGRLTGDKSETYN